MTDKELRRLKRDDLLQILINQQRQIEDLTALVEDYEKQLGERRIAVEESGNLAEASLKLNGVFEAAQRAADQYLEETRARLEGVRAEADRAQKQAEDTVKKAQAEAERLLAAARREADELRQQAQYIPPQPVEAAPEMPEEPRKGGLFRRKRT